jgi:flavin reductase (DIM6/NTAB) family NADH-FMN oxidoreductase RutF
MREMAAMIFDPENLDEISCYKLLIGSVVPRAIGWASTLSPEGVPNLAPFSFFTVVCRKPPMVSLTMQPKSDGKHLKDTFINIRETKEFVVNIATPRLTNAMHASSTAFAPEVDEFAAVGLRKIASDLVKPPRVADAPISMECRLEQILPMGDVNDHLVIGRIVRFHVADELALENGRIDTAGLRPVGRLAAEYALVEHVFACPVADGVLEQRDHRMRRIDERDPQWSPLKEAAWSPAGDAKPL